jgi:hypothetical protein
MPGSSRSSSFLSLSPASLSTAKPFWDMPPTRMLKHAAQKVTILNGQIWSMMLKSSSPWRPIDSIQVKGTISAMNCAPGPSTLTLNIPAAKASRMNATSIANLRVSNGSILLCLTLVATPKQLGLGKLASWKILSHLWPPSGTQLQYHQRQRQRQRTALRKRRMVPRASLDSDSSPWLPFSPWPSETKNDRRRDLHVRWFGAAMQ